MELHWSGPSDRMHEKLENLKAGRARQDFAVLAVGSGRETAESQWFRRRRVNGLDHETAKHSAVGRFEAQSCISSGHDRLLRFDKTTVTSMVKSLHEQNTWRGVNVYGGAVDWAPGPCWTRRETSVSRHSIDWLDWK